MRWATGAMGWAGRFAVAPEYAAVAVLGALALTGGHAGATARADERAATGELLEARTATTKTFRNADGSYTKRLFAGPVHYRDGGAWQEIRTRVIPVWQSLGGTQAIAPPADDYTLRNQAGAFGALFKAHPGADFIRLDVAHRSYGLSLDGARAQAVARPSGSAVEYKGALAGADLRYDVLAEGVKESIVLTGPDAPAHYRFRLTSPAGSQVEAKPRRDGSVSFRADGRRAFLLHVPFAVDSGPAPATGSRKALDRDRQSHVAMSVTQTGQDFAIELTVDSAWLADPARRFPVTVDPTITVQPTSQSAEFEGTCGSCEGLDWGSVDLGTDDVSSWRGGF